jgi:hypothetical protein
VLKLNTGPSNTLIKAILIVLLVPALANHENEYGTPVARPDKILVIRKFPLTPVMRVALAVPSGEISVLAETEAPLLAQPVNTLDVGIMFVRVSSINKPLGANVAGL